MELAYNIFINSFDYINMITLKEKKEFLNFLIGISTLTTDEKKILRAIKKDVIAWNKPLKLPKPDKITK